MSNVPYKAYQSKRHSRNLSNTFTPPQSPPLAPVGSPSKPPTLLASNSVSKRLSIPNGASDLSLHAPLPPAAVAPPEPAPSPQVAPSPVPLAVATLAAPVSIIEVPPSPISQQTTSPTSPQVVDETENNKEYGAVADTNINAAEAPNEPVTSSTLTLSPSDPTPAPAMATSPEKEVPPATPRPRQISHSHSKFRHIPARGSPLRPNSAAPTHLGSYAHAPSHLASNLPARAPLAPTSSQLKTRTIGSTSRILDFSPITSNATQPTPNGPNISSSLVPPSEMRSLKPSPGSTPTLDTSLPVPPPKSASPSPASSPLPTASPSRPTISPSSSPSGTTSVPSPTLRSSTIGNTPYRHGFQPKGVCGIRTDEFLEMRRAKRDVARIEDRRLERRLEKLMDLHFPSPSKPTTANKSGELKVLNRRQSSFFDFDLSEFKGKNASDIWRGVLDSAASSRLGSMKNDIRQQEMAITPWQEDSAVSTCPHCHTSFNTLTNRKHHCRLCGRVVCSLPVKSSVRPEPCSFLFVVDSKTGAIEEVGGDIVDYGVKRRDFAPDLGPRDGSTAKKMAEEQEKYLKGVRICRECRPTLRRRQYAIEAKNTTPFARLYDILLILEKEIEEMLPEFQELVIRLSEEDDSTSPGSPSPTLGSQTNLKRAASLRKQLLDSFSQYDAVSKRIASLKTPGLGSSQDKVQQAVGKRATLFLQKNLFPLQALPKPRKASHSKNNSTTSLSIPSNLIEINDQDAALAHALQPLLEQEALLESFIEEANAQRKFEDAKTLKASLKEIRVEIDKLLSGREPTGSKEGMPTKGDPKT